MCFEKTPVLNVFLALITLHSLKSAVFRLVLGEQIRSYSHAAIIVTVYKTIFTLGLDMGDQLFVC